MLPYPEINNGKPFFDYLNIEDFDYNSPYFTRETSNNQALDFYSYSSIQEIFPFSILEQNVNEIQEININNDENVSENSNNNIIIPSNEKKKIFNIQKIEKKQNNQGRKKKGITYTGSNGKSRPDHLLTKVKIQLIKSLRKYLNKKIKLINKGSKKYLLKRAKLSFSKQNTEFESAYLNKKIKEIFSEEKEGKNWNKNAIKKILDENKSTELIDILNNKTLKDMYELYISNTISDFCLKNDFEEISKKYPNDKKFLKEYKETADHMIEMINKKIPRTSNSSKKNNKYLRCVLS
jgi:hypothetical protein